MLATFLDFGAQKKDLISASDWSRDPTQAIDRQLWTDLCKTAKRHSINRLLIVSMLQTVGMQVCILAI